eukprot:CAMPEP_0194744464 /NCGR_PEP_ID=MMETSP0296-20130528/100886_1 /TAXON_ID=39354 /ORGANISM="Heterosigma akashiwo, Strain CCMP2393" /LENGTH=112 /DNA_ID=CAMNT_0039656613 /DNA_START=509 /DNA_END=845 /DNA_ORIENTATION=-
MTAAAERDNRDAIFEEISYILSLHTTIAAQQDRSVFLKEEKEQKKKEKSTKNTARKNDDDGSDGDGKMVMMIENGSSMIESGSRIYIRAKIVYCSIFITDLLCGGRRRRRYE